MRWSAVFSTLCAVYLALDVAIRWGSYHLTQRRMVAPLVSAVFDIPFIPSLRMAHLPAVGSLRSPPRVAAVESALDLPSPRCYPWRGWP